MTKAQRDNPVPLRQSLRVLIVEDNPADVELVVPALKRAGYSLSFDVVDSLAQFQQQLEQRDYDVILADYNLRTWTGMDALAALKRSAKDIPFLVVTGTLGDEAAVECIKQGATDYVLKDRLRRLPLAVERALHEKAQREAAASLEEHIHRAKEEWETTFDTVPDPVFLLDEACRIQRANRAAATLLGVEPAQLIGQRCYQAVHGLAEPIAGCPYQRMLMTGKEERNDIEDPRSGKSFDVTATPLRDRSGAVRGCVHVFRDITERKRVEEALRASEERYRLLFERNLAGVFRTTVDGRIVDCNDSFARIFGCASREEVLSHQAWDFYRRPIDREAVIASLREQKTLTNFEICLRRKDGRDVWVLENGTLVETEDSPGVIEGTLIDITERKGLEEQLRQGQKMEAIGRLAGGVAHDFNNLLTIITGYSQLLLERLGPDDPLRAHANEIKKAGDRAAALTRQLLAFGRRQVLAPQVLDLNALVTNLDKLLRRLIGEDIDLVTARGEPLGRVKADPGQIEQVIMNLAVNARDAMPRGGKLTIETANVDLDGPYIRSHADVTPGPYVMLAVSDTGCGMDAETQAHIFEPFFTTKEQGKGTGLGLATVYGIVKQSGGNICVYSHPGEGATFKVYLPRVTETVGALEPARVPARLPWGSETILLVEDEGAVRSLARQVLESNGYRVLEARNGEEALLLSQDHRGPIQLLLTDVVMPEMGGPELVEHLAPFHREMKVLYVSGYTDEAIFHHGVLDSGSAFLQKPFTPEALTRKVREVLDAPRDVAS